MGEINEYYGVASTATSDYLAHYGVLGMKWGVRRAVNSGDSQKLSKQYAKAQKKLAKLEKRAANSGKYARRAAAMGAGAAAAGAVAGLGAEKIARGAGNITSKAGRALIRVSGTNPTLTKVGGALTRSGNSLIASNSAVSKWAKQKAGVSDTITKGMVDAGSGISKVAGKAGPKSIVYQKGVLGGQKLQAAGRNINRAGGISHDTLLRVGAGALGAGLAAGAARNAYKAATAKKKAEKFRAEMNKAFAGTQYGRKSSGASKSKKRR